MPRRTFEKIDRPDVCVELDLSWILDTVTETTSQWHRLKGFDGAVDAGYVCFNCLDTNNGSQKWIARCNLTKGNAKFQTKEKAFEYVESEVRRYCTKEER
ncbi:MAG: hypothetical protein LBI05_09880 [Planctomycetaceae bacterium]|jgi:hypothetical protein|nr:hypothetical protein [Planctomycetaceae bacterium]